MKNYGDLRGCYPIRPTASTDKTLLDLHNYFGGVRSKGFATLRNIAKLQFLTKIEHAKSVGLRYYSAI